MAGQETIDILLAISNNILREGLHRILLEARFPVRIFSPDAGHPAPDLILFDINQPIRKLRTLYPQAKPVLLDTGIDMNNINFLLMCHQVRGVIAPDESIQMFHKALRIIYEGDIWIDQSHLKALLKGAEAMTQSGELKGLSLQDNRIICMISAGKKNQEIAENLCLSEHTIKSHVSRIYKRLHVKNRAQLVSLAQSSILCEMNEAE
ncbi:MAG: response regulator transcription factor [Deltaproteobacteria bacterium]|jgi:DNA-binding NarL/FixJ family response regulator|nr:response regulator transcription factor [Deltaproteobacteria bacterium]MCW8893946.1 response regulator transcription factor [Deltaproteobacteria bacterium]MCW9048801.1 response regulator transcription factor [Deltaproteobacteria bacterium]